MITERALNELAIRKVECVEIFINSNCELKKSFLYNLKSIIKSHGIKVSSIHPYTCGIEPMMFFTQYPRRFLDILDYYKKYFEAMNLLGADIFVFHGNKPQNKFPDEMYFERYNGLYELGKTFGVTVAQENVVRCTSGDIAFLKKMIDTLGDSAKFVLDTKQAVRKGINPYDMVDLLGERIVHIHLSDYDEKNDCQLVGKGKLDFVKFINKLKEYSYTGSIILELYSNGYSDVDELVHNFDLVNETLDKHC